MKTTLTDGKGHYLTSTLDITTENTGKEIVMKAKQTIEHGASPEIIRINGRTVDVVVKKNDEYLDVVEYEVITTAGVKTKKKLSDKEKLFCQEAKQNGRYRYNIDTDESSYFAKLDRIYNPAEVKINQYDIITVSDQEARFGEITDWDIEQWNIEAEESQPRTQWFFATMEDARKFVQETFTEKKYTIKHSDDPEPEGEEK